MKNELPTTRTSAHFLSPRSVGTRSPKPSAWYRRSRTSPTKPPPIPPPLRPPYILSASSPDILRRTVSKTSQASYRVAKTSSSRKLSATQWDPCESKHLEPLQRCLVQDDDQQLDKRSLPSCRKHEVAPTSAPLKIAIDTVTFVENGRVPLAPQALSGPVGVFG